MSSPSSHIDYRLINIFSTVAKIMFSMSNDMLILYTIHTCKWAVLLEDSINYTYYYVPATYL